MKRGIDDYIPLSERARIVDEARARRLAEKPKPLILTYDRVSSYPYRVKLPKAKRHG